MNTGGLVLSDPLLTLLDETTREGRPSRATVTRCVAAAPCRVGLLQLLGLQGLAGGDVMRAVLLLGKAARSDPTNTSIINNLGVALLAAGDATNAASCLRRAIPLGTDLVCTYGNLGLALHMLGDDDEAASVLSMALALGGEGTPRIVRQRLAEVRIAQRRFEEAERMLRELIADDPRDIDAMLTMGRLRSRKLEWIEAVTWFDRVLAVQPAHLGAVCALAEIVDDAEVGALADRLQCARMTASDPKEQYRVHWALTILSQLRRDVDSEFFHCRRALEYCPDSVEAQVNLAKLSLLVGDFDTGWRAFEWRWRQKPEFLRPRNMARPCWRGEALNGSTILLHAEQGLGSMIQFARYASLVAASGGRVILEMPHLLVRLMGSLKGVDRVVAQGESVAPVVWQCPLMSLPLAFKTQVSTIPADIPYLAADPQEVRAWSDRLPKQFRVGIVWAGSPHRLPNNRRRSMSASALAPLGEIAGLTFVSLQHHAHSNASRLPFEHFDAAPELTDLAVTAAVIETLDLIITVDTAIAHLAGALGKSVWIMLPYAAEYRWLLDRQDSPWYPTARLFRQPSPGNWGSVVARIAGELRGLAAGERN